MRVRRPAATQIIAYRVAIKPMIILATDLLLPEPTVSEYGEFIEDKYIRSDTRIDAEETVVKRAYSYCTQVVRPSSYNKKSQSMSLQKCPTKTASIFE